MDVYAEAGGFDVDASINEGVSFSSDLCYLVKKCAMTLVMAEFVFCFVKYAGIPY